MKLLAEPRDLHQAYVTADPFPHAVIDGLFPEQDLQEVRCLFPGPDEIEWVRFASSEERKLGFHHRSLYALPHPIRDFLFWMNSPPVLEFLEQLTGIAGLIPDPYFGGGGLHQTLPGGFLQIHADFNVHPLLRLDRRLNVLVFLNESWPEEYGGELELWDAEMRSCRRRILPIWNRTVIFSTTDSSYHGHPKPLSCPADRTRKSLSFYYYTNGRPAEEASAPHDTIFRA